MAFKFGTLKSLVLMLMLVMVHKVRPQALPPRRCGGRAWVRFNMLMLCYLFVVVAVVVAVVVFFVVVVCCLLFVVCFLT